MNNEQIKRVAVTILNWNGRALLEKFLPSVVAYTPADLAVIIVVDNGSTDDSIQLLKEKFPTVQIVSFKRNHGFAEGYNLAIQDIFYEYTVLLNSDVEVTPGWLDAPIAAMDADPRIAAVQPKILSLRNKEYFEYAGAAGGFIDFFGYPYCRGRIFNVIEKDEGQYDTKADLFWASGACLFVRTEEYKMARGLDDRFFAHQEEIDFCWRLRSRGYRVVCTPKSVVYHLGGGTLNTEHPHKTFLNFRNNLLMLYKNLPDGKLEPILFIRFFLDYIAAAKFLFTGHYKNAKAVYEARRAFHKMKFDFFGSRLENRILTCVERIPERKRGSILVSFYLLFKRKFSSL